LSRHRPGKVLDSLVEPAGGFLSRERAGILTYLACVRYPEVLILQGSPLLGLAFSDRRFSPGMLGVSATFAVASFLLVAHIFSFNDWANVALDSSDPNKSTRVFSTKGITPRGVLGLSLGLLAGSLLLFAFLPRRTFVLAVAIAALGILYSHPSVNAKGIPVVSSLPHLIGGTLHFLLGYSVFSSIDRRGILIALFFALTFTAGHLNQEVRDHDGDRPNGVRTNAVAFGKRATFLGGLVVFTLAYADLLLLACSGIVPAVVGVLPLALYPLHIFWSVGTLRHELTFESVSRFQRRYRALYAVMGLGMIVALLHG
jgi:4-hydroxybenzoate polyprenyltransferase